MKLYLWIIAIGGAVIFLANFLVFSVIGDSFYWWHLLVLTIGVIVALFLVDLIFAFFVRVWPKRWFSHKKRFFVVGKREMRFYERLGIVRWKDRVPEIGKLVGYDKTKVGERTADNILEFLYETGYGEVIHWWCLVASFIVMGIYFLLPFWDIRLFLTTILPASIVNFFLNLAPVFIQRYNRPRLVRIYELQLKKEKSIKEKTQALQ